MILLPASSPCPRAPARDTEQVEAVSHYKTNLRDIEFNLFEVLGRDEVLGTGPFAGGTSKIKNVYLVKGAS